MVVLAVVCGLGVYALRAVNHTPKVVSSGPKAASTPTATASVPSTNNLDLALKTQAAALVAGDRVGWMAMVDPSAHEAVAEYQRIFDNLRQMHVAYYAQAAIYDEIPVSVNPQQYSIDASFCLITAGCTELAATLTVTLELKAGQVRVESFQMPTKDPQHDSPLPWLVANLSVKVDPARRIVLAASSNEASHLSAAMTDAQHAATVADTFAHWGKPQVYLVYLADPAEAQLWFGSVSNAADYTVTTDPVDRSDIEMALFLPKANEGGSSEMTATLQWGMGEVALEYGTYGTGNNSFANGLADYIASEGHSFWMSDAINEVRTWVHTGKWKRNVYMTSELDSSDRLTSSASEDIGYLAIRHLIQKYGLSKTLSFWGYVERDGMSLEASSTSAFGVSWTSVNADCVSYIQHLI